MVQRIINSTPHSSIGVSPAQLLFGNNIQLDRGLISTESQSMPLSEPVGINIQKWLDKMFANQAILLEIASNHLKEKDNAHLSSINQEDATSFEVGTYVLAQYPPTKMGKLPPTKLHTPWKGPFKVIKVNGSKYTLQNLVTMKCEDVHVSLLKKFHFDEQHTKPEEVALSDSQSFIVEQILAHKGNVRKKTTLHFKVKWMGYETTTWEPWKNVKSNIKVHQYLIAKGLGHLIPKAFQL